MAIPQVFVHVWRNYKVVTVTCRRLCLGGIIQHDVCTTHLWTQSLGHKGKSAMMMMMMMDYGYIVFVYVDICSHGHW